MKLKIPPDFVMIICIGLMWLLDQVGTVGALIFTGSRYVTFGILLLGIIWVVLALREFYKASTTSDPRNVQNVNALVDSGIYRISRNPMYTGMICILIATVFYLENLLTLLIVPFFILYMSEEEMLSKKFGDEYRRYKSEVRRWL